MPKKSGTKYSESMIHNLQQGTNLRSIIIIFQNLKYSKHSMAARTEGNIKLV